MMASDEKTVLAMREYGRVRMTLKPLMDARGMTRNALARSVNTRFEVIDKWYEGEVEKVDMDVLARICYVLNCQISDILRYEKE